MDQICPDQALVPILLTIVRNEGAGLVWALYQNNVTPGLGSVLANFELASDTWGQTTLDDTDFTDTEVRDHVGFIQADNLIFTNTTGTAQTVYGYVVFNDTASVIVAAARFDDSPRSIADDGECLVIPIFGDLSQSEAE